MIAFLRAFRAGHSDKVPAERLVLDRAALHRRSEIASSAIEIVSPDHTDLVYHLTLGIVSSGSSLAFSIRRGQQGVAPARSSAALVSLLFAYIDLAFVGIHFID